MRRQTKKAARQTAANKKGAAEPRLSQCTSAPKSVAECAKGNDEHINDTVCERVAAGDGNNAKSCGSKSDADIQRPEVSCGRNARTRRRSAAHGECLECRGDRAETDAEEQCGSDQPGEFCDAAEEGHSSGKEEKPRADSVIRALLVKDTSDEGARHQNRARIACVEEARLCGEPETARIKWDEGKRTLP